MKNNGTIICNQCGSNDIEFISEDYGICKYCHTKVFFNKNFNVSYDKASAIKIRTLIIKNKYSQEDFLRSVYLNLAKDRDTAGNILSSDFDKVNKSFMQLIGVTAKVSLTYSVSIGYDRIEKYTVRERHYSTKAKRYYTGNVKKERTVTDWKPQSGSCGGQYVEYADNSGKEELDKFDCKYFKDELLSTSSNFIENIDNVDYMSQYLQEPKEEAIRCVKQYLSEAAIESCKNSLPGDRYKDFKADVIIKILSIDCIVAPLYKIEFHNKKSHSDRKAFPIGSMKIIGKSEMENSVSRKSVISFYSILIASILLLIASMAVSLASLNFKIMTWCFAVAVFIGIACEIILPFLDKLLCKTAKKRKLADLNKVLKRDNLKALDYEEIRSLE